MRDLLDGLAAMGEGDPSFVSGRPSPVYAADLLPVAARWCALSTRLHRALEREGELVAAAAVLAPVSPVLGMVGLGLGWSALRQALGDVEERAGGLPGLPPGGWH